MRINPVGRKHARLLKWTLTETRPDKISVDTAKHHAAGALPPLVYKASMHIERRVTPPREKNYLNRK